MKSTILKLDIIFKIEMRPKKFEIEFLDNVMEYETDKTF